MKKRLLPLLLLSIMSFLTAFTSMSQTKVIAHRGYWKTSGSAQNSIASWIKADSIGAYGSEFDVWLTADDSLVVNHDRVFKGVNFPESSFAEISEVRLDNGESVPTLAQYLEAAKKYNSPRLILEVKTFGNDSARQTLACSKIVDMVDKSGLRDRTAYIAFSLFACKELHRLSPETPVYYLEGDLTPEEVKDLGFAGIDYSYKTISNHPDWIERAKKAGIEVNVWTVDKPEIMDELIEQEVDYITTNQPVLLQERIKLKGAN
ncbi:MAG: glycerophosphodiester phosphodiesterase [Muribaculaceae bacterium]|nr:glycerophosphodiester phosphodiesterase [Muribaculaceae bacterium]